MNIQKSVAFLYTNNEILEMECKKIFFNCKHTNTHPKPKKKSDKGGKRLTYQEL